MDKRGLKKLSNAFTLGLSLLMSNSACAESSDLLLDDSFKAALIYKITKFVHWPQSTQAESSHFLFCLLNNGQAPAAFDKLETQRLFQKTIKVRSFKRSDMVDPACKVLYIPPSKAVFIDDILNHLRHRPILTVGEHVNFARRGGMIALGTHQGKVKFFINNARAEAAGIKVSATLLQLSTIVTE